MFKFNYDDCNIFTLIIKKKNEGEEVSEFNQNFYLWKLWLNKYTSKTASQHFSLMKILTFRKNLITMKNARNTQTEANFAWKEMFILELFLILK